MSVENMVVKIMSILSVEKYTIKPIIIIGTKVDTLRLVSVVRDYLVTHLGYSISKKHEHDSFISSGFVYSFTEIPDYYDMYDHILIDLYNNKTNFDARDIVKEQMIDLSNSDSYYSE